MWYSLLLGLLVVVGLWLKPGSRHSLAVAMVVVTLFVGFQAAVHHLV